MAVTVLAPNWYGDHWTGLDCDLEIRGTGALRLRLYLPADATMPETKSLAIWQADRLHHVEVHRRVFTEGGVFEAQDGRISLRLCAGHAEHARPDDDRLLGVSLWIETLDGRQIDPVTDLPTALEGGGPPKTSAPQGTRDAAPGTATPHPDEAAIGEGFDSAFYLSCFGPEDRPADPLRHYLAQGWQEGRDPTPWFSTRHYLATHRDVQAAGMNPFVHYCIQGVREGRALPILGRKSAAPYAAHVTATAPGPDYEDADPTIGAGRRPRAKVLAYYLPQFHAIPENDAFWGAGFTEWRNVVRGEPRFEGHIQPKVPRDLGFYDLMEGDTYRRQSAMARAAGIHGFCFYHYWFDGRRVLERPMERVLADPSLDFPFCIMWANENWTRTWDGAETEVLLKQTYRPEDDAAFLADIARHLRDPRYIRLDGRPLFFIYRPGHIPDTAATIARWRAMLAHDHGLQPLIYMAQAFGDNDPRVFGLDGAIEFPPHKVLNHAPDVKHTMPLIDLNFAGSIPTYDSVIEAAKRDAAPDFPLIRTVFPSWDNDARRPGRSTIVANSTPRKFEAWLSWAVDQATRHPAHGEAVLCINAWNEWAEGAYLEPDVHFGSAYLNTVARTVFGVSSRAVGERTKVLLVGHDAMNFGAQALLREIGRTLSRGFGVEVAFLLRSEGWAPGIKGALMASYEALGPVHIHDLADPALQGLLSDLVDRGFARAITNTTVCGGFVPALKDAGMAVVSLVHELPGLIRSYGLMPQAQALAARADRVIFPAAVVRDAFLGLTGPAHGAVEIFPQGLYKAHLLSTPRGDGGLRAELGLPAGTRLVIGVGYADLRKGIDRFTATAIAMCRQHDDMAFVWVGAPSGEATSWHMPDVDRAGLSDRIRITGHVDDVERYYAAADVFFLTSREDPFPSVVMEALAMGLPAVGYAGCGGCDEMIARHGRLVPEGDLNAPARAIADLLDMPPAKARRAAADRRAFIADTHPFDRYGMGLLQRLDPALPAVSVVLPSYNYADYMADRLGSILDQTCPVFEVIVIDDASSDGSAEAARRIARNRGRDITLIVNDRRAGSPFPNWRKGARMARGDLIWIAEADDSADPAFLATLAARMQETGAALGFCDSRQMDGDGAPLGDSYRPYMNGIEAGAFDAPLVMEGPEFAARFLAVKNVILNVSGVLFRREALLAALDATGNELDGLRVAGDWRLYTEICLGGGRVVYDPAPLNAHRRHRGSVTHALDAERHLSEIARMQRLTAEALPLRPETRDRQRRHIDEARRHLQGMRAAAGSG
jgi:glycosyltransferase involved in cell wall biosynthesis